MRRIKLQVTSIFLRNNILQVLIFLYRKHDRNTKYNKNFTRRVRYGRVIIPKEADSAQYNDLCFTFTICLQEFTRSYSKEKSYCNKLGNYLLQMYYSSVKIGLNERRIYILLMGCFRVTPLVSI